MKNMLRCFGLILFLVCMFPPWVRTIHRENERGSLPLGYAPVFMPPVTKVSEAPCFATGIDLVRLSLEALALSALLGIGLTYTWRR